ncbi:hypothetical protein GCM10023335_54940 [Streptomyces siamensis]|uniref:Uncharacterized protein n=1 Tax=Streptomyces siamensis TaxID=1274986 RepID=A0ABP9J7Q7_9ACTN
MSAHSPFRPLGHGEHPPLPGHFGLPPDGLKAILEPVAQAFGRHFAVVEKTIEDRREEDFVSVTLGDGLEDQVRLDAFEKHSLFHRVTDETP